MIFPSHIPNIIFGLRILAAPATLVLAWLDRASPLVV
jgi:hypothetical protein